MNLHSVFKIVASAALFFFVLWYIGPERVLESCTHADPYWLAAGLSASLLANLLSALRWHAIAAWLGINASRLDMILAYFRSVTANTVLPGATLGGDALRALHLQSSGHAIALAAASVVLDRLSGLWILLAISMATTGVALAINMMPIKIVPLPSYVVLLLALLLLLLPILIWQLSVRFGQVLPARIKTLLIALHARPRPVQLYLTQILRSGSVQLFSITAFACGGYAVGVDLAWWQFAIAAGPVFLFAALPVGVGGWGTREAASALVLGAFGTTHEMAVATAILYGVFATLLGLLGALSLFISKGKPDG